MADVYQQFVPVDHPCMEMALTLIEAAAPWSPDIVELVAFGINRGMALALASPEWAQATLLTSAPAEVVADRISVCRAFITQHPIEAVPV